MKKDHSYESWIQSIGLVLAYRKSSDYIPEQWELTEQRKDYWENIERIYERYIQSQQKDNK